MTRFEIIVEIDGKQKYLDTEGVENISLNFNIADITDPEKRNSSYSKTIKIPETRNNRALFGDISDLTIDSTFNPNKKTRCWVLVDTIVVFEGSIQLRKVSMDWKYDYSFYECVVYSDNDNLFKEIGETYLTDLDFSELDHDWDKPTIMNSWKHSWNDGYFYPLIDYGYDFNLSSINALLITGTSGQTPNPGVRVSQMFPATNVKYILDKIFNTAGYSYNSTFFETNEFKNLYIPYNRDGRYLKDPNDLTGRFTVGVTSSGLSFSCNNPAAYAEPNITLQNQPAYSNDDQIVVLLKDYKIPFVNETSPYGDPNNVFNTLTYEYVAPLVDIPEQRFSFTFDIDFLWVTSYLPENNGSPGLDFTLPNILGNPSVNWTGLQVKREKNAVGGSPAGGVNVYCNGSNVRIPFIPDSIPNIQYLNQEIILIPQDGEAGTFPSTPTSRRNFSGDKRVKGTITTDLFGIGSLNHPLFPGEKVWIELTFTIKSTMLRFQVAKKIFTDAGLTPQQAEANIINNRMYLYLSDNCFGVIPPPTPHTSPYMDVSGLLPPTLNPTTACNQLWYKVGADVGRFFPTTFFYNNLSPEYAPGEVIPYNQAIPLNVKQKDFITSLIKLFNLYVEPTKGNPKNLIIEPRDIYYEQGNSVIKDWTYKLDTNDTIDEQILAETQNREIVLKYKDDKDFYNEDYTSKKAGDNYGIQTIEIDNDFTRGVKKIEPIFSPTPLVPLTGTDYIVIPKIGKLNNGVFSKTDHNIRILTRYAVKEIKSWPYSLVVVVTGQGPYAGYISLVGGITHNYKVGDVINVNQADSGAAYPALQGTFVVLEVLSTTSIVINLVALIVPVGTPGGSTITQDGLYAVAHKNVNWKFEFTKLGYVPYLGHLDDPFESRYDLNYGQATTYFPYKSLTNNNLYNLYYKNLLDEITSKDSKIITASFYLTAADIADFYFSDKIYIKNQYFKVNKIQNYDPTKEKTCKVELIKSGVSSITINRIQNTGLDENPFEVPGDAIDIVERVNPFYVGMSNPSNDISSSNTIVSGDENYVNANDSLVVGSNNIVAGSSNFVFGSGNTMEGYSNGNLVFGNTNKVSGGIAGSIVFGSNTTTMNSNTLQINQRFIVTSNFISAGRDEVLNLYFDNKPTNYISGSRDAVREFGSQDPISYITANIDAV